MISRGLSGFEYPNRGCSNRIEAITISVMEQAALPLRNAKSLHYSQMNCIG
jgi:hypothetical protein